ncbi:hypothetical protein [Streptomyces sp. NPDC004728]|uniref:hypothetical protein n=1 Tax=Streptomyces sp. NPDC004728 TaxID=3154289 RepID=UPI0033B802E6
MSHETPEQNRYSRAVEASFARQTGPREDGFFAANHKLLTEHAPAAGPNPACTAAGCETVWPCATAESAMAQVGVRQ